MFPITTFHYPNWMNSSMQVRAKEDSSFAILDRASFLATLKRFHDSNQRYVLCFDTPLTHPFRRVMNVH
jgi:hypothetical protein